MKSCVEMRELETRVPPTLSTPGTDAATATSGDLAKAVSDAIPRVARSLLSS